jgi:hypothetical protein
VKMFYAFLWQVRWKASISLEGCCCNSNCFCSCSEYSLLVGVPHPKN